MNINFTRDEALALLKKYNKEKFHIEHALTLEGVMGWYARELGYGEEEQFWRDFVKNHIPTAYPGMGEIIAEFKARGGIVAVDSHSVSENIIRDYKANGLPDPDVIYGWDIPKEMRKPAPGTLFDLMEKFDLKPEEILVVDDLKPGYDMARGAGVPFAAASWAYNVQSIRDFMKENCDFFLETVEDLRKLLFEE